jgi:DNA-binding CsgD family transcriptional regulator
MELTPRQSEIGRLVARGMSNKAIARHLGLTTHTVDHHISEAAARIPGDGQPRYKVMVMFLSIRDDAA